jgi:hypothetical protein
MSVVRRTIALVVTLLLVATATLSAALSVGAASPVDSSLCHSTTSRLSIADSFPLSVCFDGSNLVVKNTTVLMVQVDPLGPTGPTAPPGTWTRSAETTNAVSLTAAALDATPSNLPPGFQVTIPISSQAETFKLYLAPDENRLFWMQFVSGLIPSNAYADYSAFSAFADSMDALDSSHQQCIKSATNFLEDAVCDLETVASAQLALQTLGNDLVLGSFTKSDLLTTADKKFAGLLSLALNLVESDVSLFENNQQFADFLNAPKRILFSAGPSTAACTTTSIMSGVPAYAAATPGYAGIYQPVGQPTCNDGWAEQQANQLSSTGQYEGPEIVYTQVNNGAWKVVAVGEGDDCAYVPTAGLAALDPSSLPCPGSSGGAPSPANPTTTAPSAAPTALPTLKVVGADGSTVFDGTRPSWIHYSVDDTDVVQDITWSSWTATSATGSGTWNYDSCSPDCDSAPRVPYPATITLSDPQGGMFTTMTETTSGPQGSTTAFTYPSEWAMSACTTGPC